MTEITAMEDVKMSETQDLATITEVSKAASSSDRDVAMGDGGDHEKMVKAAMQSELSRLPYIPILNFLFSTKSNSTLRIRIFHMTSEQPDCILPPTNSTDPFPLSLQIHVDSIF